MNELYLVKAQELLMFLMTRDTLDKEQAILLAQVERTIQKHYRFIEGQLDAAIENQDRP